MNIYMYVCDDKFNTINIIVTGVSGLLGSALKDILIADYPSHESFDVNNSVQMNTVLSTKKYTICVHCAAISSPDEVEKFPFRGFDVNIVGTANLVLLCCKYNIKLIYISTSYVFDGNYNENSPVNPINKYGLSKLGGECCVRLYNNSLIIRLATGTNVFPYSNAYDDQYISREPVSVISQKIKSILNTNMTGIIHIGSHRRSQYEYARSISIKDIGKIHINMSTYPIPRDTSFNTKKYDSFNFLE